MYVYNTDRLNCEVAIDIWRKVESAFSSVSELVWAEFLKSYSLYVFLIIVLSTVSSFNISSNGNCSTKIPTITIHFSNICWQLRCVNWLSHIYF